MPVIYRDIEIGPWFRAVPQYARKHVRNLAVLLDDTETRGWVVLEREQKAGVRGLWTYLAREFPSLTCVRLLFYPNRPTRASKYCGMPLRSVLEGFTQMKHLEKVVVGAHTKAARRPNFLMRAMEEVCDKAIVAVKAEVARKDKQIEVIKSTFDKSSCLVCTMGMVQ